MWNLFDEISIRMNDAIQTLDYHIELNRPTYGLKSSDGRKAGTSVSSRANTSSANDNGATKQTSVNDNKSTTTKPNLPLVMMQKLYPEQSATNPEPKPDQDHEAVKAQTAETEVKKNGNSEKSHQRAMAEAQAPEEPAGAEKITVATSNEAAMQQKPVVQPNRNVINMDLFGVDIDLDKMAGATEPHINLPAARPVQQIPNMQQQQMWAAQQLGNVGYTHRVDNPSIPKPKKEKTPADDVEVKIPDIAAGAVNPPVVKESVDPVPAPTVQPSTSQDVKPEKVTMFDNTNMVTRYDYLGEIEKIASENNIPVQFVERADHMINVIVWANGIPSREKGFTIDPGFVIDRRKKIFPGIFNFYEGMQAYPLFVGGADKRQSINKSLIEGLLVGGNKYPDEKKQGLYRPEYRELNRYIDLSTIPTKNINGEDRKWIQNRLVASLNKGFFSKYTPEGSRFAITEFDSKKKEIYISNRGVATNYGLPPAEPLEVVEYVIRKNDAARVKRR